MRQVFEREGGTRVTEGGLRGFREGGVRGVRVHSSQRGLCGVLRERDGNWELKKDVAE